MKYLIGDVQGCFDSLQSLLAKINFDPAKDQLGFVGDLVNRGPKSLETLRFIIALNHPLIVLGNHDLHFLALYFLGTSKFHHIAHTLDSVLASRACKQYVDFLLTQPFIYTNNTFAMVHAGIPPQWDIPTAKNYSDEISLSLQKNPEAFFNHIYGNQPNAWRDDLEGWDRTRYIVNAFTRMRFCDKAGKLDLTNKTDFSTQPDFTAWFLWRDFAQDQQDIYFGHWASLEGRCAQPHVFALDTGCVWGGKLTAIMPPSKKIIAVRSVDI